MLKNDATYLNDSANYAVRLYSIHDLCKILRMHPCSFRQLYYKHIPPLKAGRDKRSKAYWTDLDVYKAIDRRFPNLDDERRAFLKAHLLPGGVKRD